MEEISKNDFRESLIDVRKAYRLLYEYQRRILDLMKYIGNYYDRELYAGFPIYSQITPRKTSVRFEKWAWDWLNMYLYEFNFGLKDDVRFISVIESDSGYYDAGYPRDKRDIKVYNSPELSTSRIYLIASTDLKKGPFTTVLHKDKLKSNMIELILFPEDKPEWIALPVELVDLFDKEKCISTLRYFNELCKKQLEISLL